MQTIKNKILELEAMRSLLFTDCSVLGFEEDTRDLYEAVKENEAALDEARQELAASILTVIKPYLNGDM